MRTNEDIMNGLHIYYHPESGSIYLVQDNYSHSLSLIKRKLAYAEQIGCTLPSEDEITIQVLAGERYKGVMSIEFKTTTKPSRFTELTKGSGLWEWLKY